MATLCIQYAQNSLHKNQICGQEIIMLKPLTVAENTEYLLQDYLTKPQKFSLLKMKFSFLILFLFVLFMANLSLLLFQDSLSHKPFEITKTTFRL